MPLPWMNNPGIDGIDELTSAEEAIVASIASLGTAGQVLAVNGAADGVEWVTGGGGSSVITDLTGTAWRVVYTDGSGNVTELALGSSGTYLQSNGASSAPTWATPAGSGDVTAASTITDNAIVRGDGGAKGVQQSGITISDTDVVSGVTQLNVDNIRVDGNTISSTDTNGNVNITPNGTGNVLIGTLPFNADQTVGAGQDNYVLTYDDATGLINLEASAGGGLADVVDDTTPQLGGNLDVNGNKIVSVSNGNIDIEPNGTGNVLLGNLVFDADQTVGAGQDNYVLTYDNGTGLISLEVATGGGTTTNINNVFVDQSGGTSDTYGALSGTINGSNAVFTVSQGSYASGTLKVWLNGQLQTQGSSEDFVETTPGSGTFTFATAPVSGDEITAEYQLVDTSSGGQSVNVEAAGSATLVTGELSTGVTSVLNIVESNAASQTITLPAATTANVGKFYQIYNKGTNRMTITSASTLNGDSVVLAASAGCIAYVESNGNYRLVGTGNESSEVQFAVTDWTTNTATGDGQYYFRVPAKLNGWEITAVHAEVITAGTTGTTDIQIHNVTDAVDILSTKLTIDSGETGSDTAATAAVINTSNDELATNDVLRVDVDAVSTTPAQGLIVSFTAQPK